MPAKLSQKPRSWGSRYDLLPSSPPASPFSEEPNNGRQFLAANNSPLPQKQHDKSPPEASIFVGSLPSNIDHLELACMLTDHFKNYPEKKNVKVIRDSKGGICAFIQCEDAAAAGRLLQILHSNPPPTFLGRFLRFERARASRTLLLSYRTPMMVLPNISSETPGTAKYIKLEPATVLRLWKPRGARFFSPLYDTQAREAESRFQNLQEQNSDDASLFLCPLTYDGETLRTIATFFGPLEYFRSYPPNTTPPTESTPQHDRQEADAQSKDNISTNSYSCPHNAQRSPGMDTGCWEVKWERRDDAVTALMSLRNIEHLTITWAHQPAPSNLSSPVAVTTPGSGSGSRFSDLNLPSSSGHLHQPSTPKVESPVVRTPAGLSPMLSVRTGQTDGRDTKEDIALSPIHSIASASNVAENAAAASVGTSTNVKKSPWTERDFPPLIDAKPKISITTAWELRSEFEVDSRSEGEMNFEFASLTINPQSGTMQSIVEVPQTTSTQSFDAQELDMPPTPAFVRSPLTPQTGSTIPPTPSDFQSATCSDRRRSFEGDGGEKKSDPTTIFVGGLETYGPDAWDDEKVRNVFARYGAIENIEFVRPLGNKPAFAFVKYDNTEAPSRAVAEEHNRSFNGRLMRVQIREFNPPARQWRTPYNRGRGRLSQYSGQIRQFDVENQIQQPDWTVGTVSSNLEDLASNHANSTSSPSTIVEDAAVTEKQESPANHQSPEASPESPTTAFTLTVNQTHQLFKDAPSSSSPPTSPPSNPSASVVAPTVQYPAGYYPPQAWMQQYSQQMSHLPFGYPGYPMVAHQIPQAFATPPASETGGSGSGTPHPWAAMGGMYTPFMPYHPGFRALVDNSQTQPQAQQPDARSPPLVPTGFMQSEQGGLVPVYNPDALNHYMSGNQQSTTSQQQVQNVPAWNPCVQMPMYPFFPIPTSMALPPPELQSNQSMYPVGASWIPDMYRVGSGFPTVPVGNTYPPSNPAQQPFRGSYHGAKDGYRDMNDMPPTPNRRHNRRGRPSGPDGQNSGGIRRRHASDNYIQQGYHTGGLSHSFGPGRVKPPFMRYGSGAGNDWGHWVQSA